MDVNIRDTCISIMECSEIERRAIHVEEDYSGQENKRFLIIGNLKSVLKYSSNAYQIN